MFVSASLQIHAIPAEAGIQAAAGVALPEAATVRETIQNQVLTERWIPAFAGKTRVAHTEIVTIPAEAARGRA